MHLSGISLLSFKNYDQLELEFSNRINCFVGDNGAGKTNMLDAIHYLSLTKSFFNPVDSQHIMHGREFFLIQGDYVRQGLEEKIQCSVQKNKRKQLRRNKKEYTRLSDHIGLFPVVMISPADSSLITEGSEERRKFMNAVISQYDNGYLECLVRYNRALAQRNVLLKSIARSSRNQAESLEIWDRQLLQNGPYIYNKRKEFVLELVPIFQDYYEKISGGLEKVGLDYQSQLHGASLDTLLHLHAEKDRILQHSTAGTHKDDLRLSLEGHPIKKLGSQGQQKTYLVALKLAKFEFIRNVNGFHPILLLDDVFDKFDARRVEQIIKLLADSNFGQIFITDTNRERIGKILNELSIAYKLFHVDKGTAKEIQ